MALFRSKKFQKGKKKKIVWLLEFNADKDPTRTDREVIE